MITFLAERYAVTSPHQLHTQNETLLYRIYLRTTNVITYNVNRNGFTYPDVLFNYSNTRHGQQNRKLPAPVFRRFRVRCPLHEPVDHNWREILFSVSSPSKESRDRNGASESKTEGKEANDGGGSTGAVPRYAL